jgi:electron transfer flavoprotein alpha subunit
VYLADGPTARLFDTELRARFITDLIQSQQPEIVLWGTSSLERETAARVAARLSTGLTAHCIDLYIEEVGGRPQLVTVVAGWGGNVSLKIICPERRPVMATINPGVFPPAEPGKRTGEVVPVPVESAPSCVEVLEVVEEEEAASLGKAEVVVVGGWGLTSMGGFEAAEELARVLGGISAGTRPAVDAGWIPHDRMIGQSGRVVAPRLLVTLGVSGAPQFSTGVLGSGLILAIDRNPDAPIFEVADIGIVGDLREVLPLLVEKAREMKRRT